MCPVSSGGTTATAAWVDAVPNDDCWTVGLSNGVHLADGTTVTDGDPTVHWGERELEKEGYVH